MQHFFVSSENVKGDRIEISDDEVLHQINRVLRMNVGYEFIALDGSGYEFICRISQIDKNKISAQIKEKRLNAAEPKTHIILYQALTKKMESFEFALQKCTELGVSEFVPMITEFTQREGVTKPERLRKILREAAEQCERGKIPVLRDEIKFSEAMKEKLSCPILLHARGQNSPLRLQAENANKIGVCEIFIGPEGGFSEKEVDCAQNANFRVCSLGKTILRAETAAISAATIIINE
ncbi:MAG: RsmE family RNA methyltransferase [Candidatus Gracilibacteria bacterium]